MKEKKLQKKIEKARKKLDKAAVKLQKLESKQAARAAERTAAFNGDVEVHPTVN